MPRYLLSMYQPDGVRPAQDVLDRVGEALHEVNDAIRSDGSWVFTGGLHGVESATVVVGGMVTDGPYLETKEHIGGIYVIEAADLDVALGWARQISDATTLPVEVRPFHDAGPY